MAKRCIVTGKVPLTVNRVSHSNVKTKHRQLPNLQRHRIWSEEQQHFITLRITARALQLIDKKGIDVVLREIRDQDRTK